MLAGLAQKLVEKKLKVEIAKEQFELFLGMAGNELLKKKIETLREGNRFEASATCSEINIKTSTNRATLPAYPAMEVDRKDAVDGSDISAAMADGAHVEPDGSQISFPLCQAKVCHGRSTKPRTRIATTLSRLLKRTLERVCCRLGRM